MNEWGQYEIKDSDKISIRNNGVVEAIRNGHPAFTNISLDGLEGWDTEDEEDHIERIDWAAVGECLGSSKVVEYLEVRIKEYDSRDNIQLLCRGLQNNRSIRALVIRCYLEYDVGNIEALAMCFSNQCTASSRTITVWNPLSLSTTMRTLNSLKDFM